MNAGSGTSIVEFLSYNKNSSTAVFRLYFSKSNGSAVRAFQVKESNYARVRVLWKVPEAKPGDFVIKANEIYFVLGPIDFNARYRRPR